MAFFRTRLLACALLPLILLACERQGTEESRPTPPNHSEKRAIADAGGSRPAAGPLLGEPVPTEIVETPSEALPVWRDSSEVALPLVLFSNSPFLVDLPTELAGEARRLVLQGTEAEIAEKSSRPRPNPVFFPEMAVSAALQADLVSELVWVIPFTGAQSEFDFEVFRHQFRQATGASAEEVASLDQSEDGIIGTLREHPLRVVTLSQLPAFSGPVLLHLDLGFFAPLYRHEIGTPLYPLVFEVLTAIKNAGYQAPAVTISASNRAGGLPLTSRFLASDLETLFTHPDHLDQPIPEEWTRRADILYLKNFFQKDEIYRRYLAMEREAPADPSVKYGLFQIEQQRKQGDSALAYLDQAVALDPIYGLAYLDLADLAFERGRPDAAFAMLDKVIAVFPDDPFIPLRKAELLDRIGHKDQTREILAKLRELPWSPVYFDRMPEVLNRIAQGDSSPSFPERYELYGR